MTKTKDDLSIDGPGSPISIKKFRKQNPSFDAKSFRSLIDQEGVGFEYDDDSLMYITPEECKKQAIFYSKEMFDGVRIPGYLYRYMNYMFNGKELIKSDELLMEQFRSGKITATSPEYIQIKNLIKYTDKNPESQQIIGLIQLLAGTMNMARKENRHVGIFLEHPDTFMHPGRTAKLMSMFEKLSDEYGQQIAVKNPKKPKK